MSEAERRPLTKTLADGVAAVLAYFLVGIPAFWLLGATPEGDIGRAIVAHGFGCLGVCLAAVVYPPSGARVAWRGVAAAPFLYAVALLVWVPFTIFVHTRLLEWLSVPFEPQEHLAYFGLAERSSPVFFGALATIVVVGPLAEEIVFRGHLRDLFTTLVGARAALVLTSAAFGVMHGIAFALPLALLGLLFGWLRERYASLAPAFAAHALHNALTVAIMLRWPDVLLETYR